MNYEAVIESILFTMGDSVELSKLAEVLELDKKEVQEGLIKACDVIDLIIEILRGSKSVKDATELDGAYQMCTKPQMYDYLIKVAKQPKHYALTDVLLETLSIIAYKQPITRAEIEKIRGVSCSHAVSRLVDYNLVCELGRLDAPGRPLLFGTTEEFLRTFGVSSIEELPILNQDQLENFKREAEEEMQMKMDI